MSTGRKTEQMLRKGKKGTIGMRQRRKSKILKVLSHLEGYRKDPEQEPPYLHVGKRGALNS